MPHDTRLGRFFGPTGETGFLGSSNQPSEGKHALTEIQSHINGRIFFPFFGSAVEVRGSYCTAG